jgi:hypothetical protein
MHKDTREGIKKVSRAAGTGPIQFQQFKSPPAIIWMAGEGALKIVVHGCGTDSGCVWTFGRYSQLIRRWGYGPDKVVLEYQPDSAIVEDPWEPKVVVTRGDAEVHRWDKVPTPAELRDYLAGELGELGKSPAEPEPVAAGAPVYGTHGIPPWGAPLEPE